MLTVLSDTAEDWAVGGYRMENEKPLFREPAPLTQTWRQKASATEEAKPLPGLAKSTLRDCA
jgi:hypothetical protein